MNEIEGVSVIVCCFNSSSRIGKTLEHLQKIRSNDIPWEVIVVDNNSEDNTAEVVNAVWNKNPVTSLKLVYENKRGLMNARMKGVEVSEFSLLSFIDDDNWIESLWVEKVFSIMKNNASIAACGGSSEGVFESNPPDWFKDYSTSFAVGHQQLENGYVDIKKGYLWGAGLTIRKKAWDDLFGSGFKSMLKGRTGKALTAGEDSELSFGWILRGWKLWYDDNLTLKHYIPDGRVSQEYLIKMYQGFGKAEVILSVYRQYIQNRNANPSWINQLITALKNVLRSGLKRLFSSGKNEKLMAKILYRHDKAYLKELVFASQKIKHLKVMIEETLLNNKRVALTVALI